MTTQTAAKRIEYPRIVAGVDGALVRAPEHVCPDSDADYELVTDATREHERLSVRYHRLDARSCVDAARHAIERIHADSAQHIPGLVY